MCHQLNIVIRNVIGVNVLSSGRKTLAGRVVCCWLRYGRFWGWGGGGEGLVGSEGGRRMVHRDIPD